MKVSEIKLGMKVVPFKKSHWGTLEYSNAWRDAKAKKQKFLYVVGVLSQFGKTVYRLRVNKNGEGGADFFLASDFKPYKKEL